MSTLTLVNWVIVIISLPGIPLGRRKPVIGWIYSLATQVFLWFPYGWWSTQYASAGLAVVMTGLYSWNLWTWRNGPPIPVILAVLKTLHRAALLPQTQYEDLCTAVRQRRHLPLPDLVSVPT